MGGRGSGRFWHYEAKSTTEDYLSIDVRRWKRDGLLTPTKSFGWQWSRHGEVAASICVRAESNRLILTYLHLSERKDCKVGSYPVYLDRTACHIGGERTWFLCPSLRCGRRVALLYGGNIFACRHCHKLAYQSQRDAWYERTARRAERIRDRLGWGPGILNGNGWKPKGMHWNTFERLTTQHDAFVQASLVGIASQLNLPGSQ